MIVVPAVGEMRDRDKSSMFAAGWTKRVKGTVAHSNAIQLRKNIHLRLLRLLIFRRIHPQTSSYSIADIMLVYQYHGGSVGHCIIYTLQEFSSETPQIFFLAFSIPFRSRESGFSYLAKPIFAEILRKSPQGGYTEFA